MIVAEISANHLGEYDRAIKLITAAAIAGADAVKLQTYKASTITLDCGEADFRIHTGLWAGRTLHDLYEQASTPYEWHAGLFEHAEREGIKCFSSPFTREDADFLRQFDPPYYKIASFEITDINLISYVATLGKPMIISTGMADADDIQLAMKAAALAPEVCLLHCVSKYPTAPEDANLRRILWLKKFCPNVGFSDHTLSTHLPVAAYVLGASVIEKHLTLDRSDGGPDAAFSLEPAEFAMMVKGIREVDSAMDQDKLSVAKLPDPHFNLRRSLYVVADIQPGQLIDEQHVRSIRPGYGLPPKYLNSLLGKRAKDFIPRGTPMHLELVA